MLSRYCFIGAPPRAIVSCVVPLTPVRTVPGRIDRTGERTRDNVAPPSPVLVAGEAGRGGSTDPARAGAASCGHPPGGRGRSEGRDVEQRVRDAVRVGGRGPV